MANDSISVGRPAAGDLQAGEKSSSEHHDRHQQRGIAVGVDSFSDVARGAHDSDQQHRAESNDDFFDLMAPPWRQW